MKTVAGSSSMKSIRLALAGAGLTCCQQACSRDAPPATATAIRPTARAYRRALPTITAAPIPTIPITGTTAPTTSWCRPPGPVIRTANCRCGRSNPSPARPVATARVPCRPSGRAPGRRPPRQTAPGCRPPSPGCHHRAHGPPSRAGRGAAVAVGAADAWDSLAMAGHCCPLHRLQRQHRGQRPGLRGPVDCQRAQAPADLRPGA